MGWKVFIRRDFWSLTVGGWRERSYSIHSRFYRHNQILNSLTQSVHWKWKLKRVRGNDDWNCRKKELKDGPKKKNRLPVFKNDTPISWSVPFCWQCGCLYLMELGKSVCILDKRWIAEAALYRYIYLLYTFNGSMDTFKLMEGGPFSVQHVALFVGYRIYRAIHTTICFTLGWPPFFSC